MKSIIILILFTVNLSCFGQFNKVDSLIMLLNNSDIIEDGNYFSPTTMIVSVPASMLIKIGKPACLKLIEVLDDSTKGILAHYVLTSILALPVQTESFIYNERDTISTISFNGLDFFIKHKTVYANQINLTENKFRWKLYIRKKKLQLT